MFYNASVSRQRIVAAILNFGHFGFSGAIPDIINRFGMINNLQKDLLSIKMDQLFLELDTNLLGMAPNQREPREGPQNG